MNSEKLIRLIYDDMQEVKKQQVAICGRLDGMDERFDGIDRRFEEVDKHFEAVDKRFDSLEAQMRENAEGIRRVSICLENEIRPSIMRIAEGHLDLNRKLDEALKVDQEKERMAVRLNFLEGRVERLETKVVGLA